MVAILDFEYDAAQEKKKFLRHVQLKDQDCEVFYEKLHYKFIQMPHFTKTEAELESHFDKWVYFLKKLETFDTISEILKEPIFEKAFKVADVCNFTRNQGDEDEQSRLDYLGVKAAIDTAESGGIIKGRLEAKIEQNFKYVKNFWLKNIPLMLRVK